MNHVRGPSTFYPEPFSLFSIPANIRVGLFVLGGFATFSTLTTCLALFFITYKFADWRKQGRVFVSHNQCVVLIYNLLLADLHQALAFALSFHWIQRNGIVAPSTACWVQAGFLQFGDVSSALFVLAIALHTVYAVLRGRKMKYVYFCTMVVGIWIVAVFLTVIGPVIHGRDFFTRAGNWCWISQKYDSDRLWLHYLWVFLVEFGTVIIYTGLFLHLRRRVAATRNNSLHSRAATARVAHAARYMLAYPVAYTVLTLPIATARMMILSGQTVSNGYLVAAGVLLGSSGWVDSILYTVSRRVLASDEGMFHDNNNIPSAHSNTHGRHSLVLRPGREKHGNFTEIAGGLSIMTSATDRQRYEKEMDELWDVPDGPSTSAEMGAFGSHPSRRGRVEARTTISIYETMSDVASEQRMLASPYHNWEEL